MDVTLTVLVVQQMNGLDWLGGYWVSLGDVVNELYISFEKETESYMK